MMENSLLLAVSEREKLENYSKEKEIAIEKFHRQLMEKDKKVESLKLEMQRDQQVSYFVDLTIIISYSIYRSLLLKHLTLRNN